MDKHPGSWRPKSTTSSPLEYAFWLAKEHWSISEAAKLLCGRNPHDKIPGAQVFNRSRRVIDVIDQAFAAAQAGEIRVARNALLPIHLLIDPSSFARWALAQGFEMPPAFTTLAETLTHVPTTAEPRAVQERVVTIARTLWIVEPGLTPSQVATHPAMRNLVPPHDATPALVLQWVSELSSL